MNGKNFIPKPIDRATPEAVEDQYGELGSVYAETRSAVAQSLGRKDEARAWSDVEAKIEADDEEES